MKHSFNSYFQVITISIDCSGIPFVSKATGSENSPAAVLFRARTRTTMKSESNLRPETI